MSSALQENSLPSDPWGIQMWISSRQLSISVWTSGRLAILEARCCCSVTKAEFNSLWPLDCSMPGSPVLHYLLEFAQCHAHRVSDAIPPSCPLAPFSSCPQSFPAAGSFPMSWLFTSGGQNIAASASVLPMNIQGWFPLLLTGLISLQSYWLSKVFSSTTVRKHQFFGTQLSL